MAATKASIVFNASEIAALVGLNAYQKPWETLCRVWRRYSRGTFEAAGIALDEDRVDALLAAHAGLAGGVAAASTAAPRDVPVLERALADAAAGLGLSAADARRVGDRARKESFCAHGTREEGCALLELGRGLELAPERVAGEDTFERRELGTLADGTVVEIGGRLDGRTCDGTVVEIKNRVGGLAFRIPGYEAPQIMAYMFVTGSTRALHVERIALADGSSLSCTHEKAWDASEWACLRGKLLAAAAFVRELATAPAAAAAFARSRTKTALLLRRLERPL